MQTRYYGESAHFERLLRMSTVSSGGARERALLSLLPARPQGMRILDAGCGLGGFSAPLRNGNALVGVDVNAECLHYVGKLGYETLRFDLEEAWPIESGSFALVLLGDVLEQLFGTGHVLSEARRVLTPDGCIIVTVPSAGFWRRRLRLLVRGEFGDDLSEHIRHFSPSSLERICRGLGLRTEATCAYAWNGGARKIGSRPHLAKPPDIGKLEALLASLPRAPGGLPALAEGKRSAEDVARAE
jgi:SAM-dependent methyltransferase